MLPLTLAPGLREVGCVPEGVTNKLDLLTRDILLQTDCQGYQAYADFLFMIAVIFLFVKHM